MKLTHEETTMISVRFNKALLRDEKDVIWYFSSPTFHRAFGVLKEGIDQPSWLELSANLINTLVASRASIHMAEDNLFKLTKNGTDNKKTWKIRIRFPGLNCLSISL